MTMKKQIPFIVLLLALLAASHPAAAQQRSSLEEMHQHLREMQRQMMQGFEDFRSAMPDISSDSSGVYFRFDTTFEGGSSHFFRFTPPGGSTDGGAGLEDFFQGFFDFKPFGEDAPNARAFPKDDGQMPHPDDELLPEERLRQEETPQGADQAAPTPPPATTKPARKKTPVPSIRI